MQSKFYRVEATTLKDQQRRVTLVSDRSTGQLTLNLQRFAMLGPGDQVQVSAGAPHKVSVISPENSDDHIVVQPAFQYAGKTSLGSYQIAFELREPQQTDDFTALDYLEQFHYKTFETAQHGDTDHRRKIETGGGRRAVLLCYLRIDDVTVPAGYIELQMPLLMVKPRHELFANPFTHPDRNISWEAWDQTAIRQYVNLIARVARVVVAPDYRGLGLAKQMLEAAKGFARTRWHIGGRRPLFLEISAEMLNYIDFVSAAGFRYAGKTEGNLARVVADLVQMRKGQKITSGIMTLQQKYLRVLERYCVESGRDFEEVLARLAAVLNEEDPASKLSPTEWLAFRAVIRFPLPYYICGLDEATTKYLETNLANKPSRPQRRGRFRAAEISFNIRQLTVSTHYRVPQTKYTRLIMDAFGIRGDELRQVVCGPIDLNFSAGNLVFVAGASGSGKSALLQALDPSLKRDPGLHLEHEALRQDYLAAWLKPIESDLPVFDYLSERYRPEEAFAALSNVGLSEAFIFLKPFRLLSRGQRYRAMLAELLLREEPVWLIDEFCSDLDPLTAKIVAYNLRRQVARSGRICFVAAANNSHFIDVLKPTSVILLTPGAMPRTVSFRNYRNDFLYKVH